MASYHLSAQIIQRSQGRSAIAAAAYRSGSRIENQSNGEVHDYCARRGVVHREILVPAGAASFLADRSKLWNYVEQIEVRKDAQLAREINLALPHELDAGQQKEMLLSFVREAFVSRGMVADVAIHAPVLEKGDHPNNHHAHIMLTLRQATADGLCKVKTREWNSDAVLVLWRNMWADHQNRALERAGVAARIDHRSLFTQKQSAAARGDLIKVAALNREAEIHIGQKARKRTSRASRESPGIQSRLERNQAIIAANLKRTQERLDLWKRAYMAHLNKPKRGKHRKLMQTGERDVSRERFVEPLFKPLPSNLAGLLNRLARGISVWTIIQQSQSARLFDFRNRYVLQNISHRSDNARNRLRLRSLNVPAVPHTVEPPIPPIDSFPRKHRVGNLSRHHHEAPSVGQAHHFGGIDEITRSLARALTDIVTHDINIRV